MHQNNPAIVCGILIILDFEGSFLYDLNVDVEN